MSTCLCVSRESLHWLYVGDKEVVRDELSSRVVLFSRAWGVQTVRRDFSLLVQTMVDTVLRKMLIDRDVEAAKEYTRRKVADLLQVLLLLFLLVVFLFLCASSASRAKSMHPVVSN